MTLAERLRRYLLSFIGDAATADAILMRCLKELLARDLPVSPGQAFRAAHLEASRVRWACAGEGADPVRLALRELPPIFRGALLLTRLESFPAAEAATIIGVSEQALIERASAAERMMKDMLFPAGGTALICDDDQASAATLSTIAWELGFNIIREPEPEAGAMRGHPGPFLIISEATDRAGRSRGPRVGRLANSVGAATLCISGSPRVCEFLRHVPGARVLRKPHGRDSAARAILDTMASHRAKALRQAILREA